MQLSEAEFFPYLKNLSETEKLMHVKKLVDEYEKIRRKYAYLLIDFQQNLEKSTYKVHDVVNALQFYFNHEEVDMESVLCNCKTIASVLGKLSKYSTFFNYDVIEFLINKFGSIEIKKKLREYEQKFREYCKHRICQIPSDAFGDAEETEKLLVLKTELEMTDSLEKLQKLQSAMNNIFSGKRFLKLVHIDDGCVKLTFSVIGFSHHLIEGREQMLRDNGILHLSYEEKHFDFCSHFKSTGMYIPIIP